MDQLRKAGIVVAAIACVIALGATAALGLKNSRLIPPRAETKQYGLGLPVEKPTLELRVYPPSERITADDDLLIRVVAFATLFPKEETIEFTITGTGVSVLPAVHQMRIEHQDIAFDEMLFVLTPKSAGRRQVLLEASPSIEREQRATWPIELVVEPPTSVFGISKSQLQDIQTASGLIGIPGLIMFFVGRHFGANSDGAKNRKRGRNR